MLIPLNYACKHFFFESCNLLARERHIKDWYRSWLPETTKMRDSLSHWADNSNFIMLKQLFLFIALTLTLQLSGQSFPSTAVGGCTSAEITSTLPSYELDLWIGPFLNINHEDCTATLDPSIFGSALRARFSLEKYNHSTGTWVSQAGPQVSPRFNNLSHGTYRILIALPRRFSNTSCQGGFEVYNTLQQYVGHWGTYTNGRTSTSNPVVVGKTVASDISYNLVDGGSGDALPNGFDYGEVVTMDATASKNYDLYWLAGFEDTAPFRYYSQGWNFTNPLGGVGSFNLSDPFGNNGFQPAFGFPQTFSQYTIQFAIENSACPNESWVNLDKVLIICPSGLGCRFEQASLQAPKLAPNPSYGSLQVLHLAEGVYTLRVLDISGLLVHEKLFQPGEEINLEGIASGMYVASIWQNDTRLFTEKLVITH